MRRGGSRQPEDLEDGADRKPFSASEFKTWRRARYWKGGTPPSGWSVAAYLESHTPSAVPPEHWTRIRPLALRAAAIATRGLYEVSAVTNAIARFLYWADREGLEVEPTVFHPDVIDRYLLSQTQLRPGTRQVGKSILRRAGRSLLGTTVYGSTSVVDRRANRGTA